MSDPLERGRELLKDLNPEVEQMLADKYDSDVPGLAESLVEWAYGRHYSRGVVDLKTRQLCTVAALTAMGGQTAPQLKVNIQHTLNAGASKEEILEVIWQMSVYGGLPAALNGVNAAQEVFAEAKD